MKLKITPLYLSLFLLAPLYGHSTETISSQKKTMRSQKSKTDCKNPVTSKKKNSPLVAVKSVEPVQVSFDNAATRKVKIENCIDKEKRTYNHWGKHVSDVTMYVNGVLIPENETREIPVGPDNKLEAKFDYDFHVIYPRAKGSKEAIFEIAPETDKLTLDFDWKNKQGHVFFAEEESLDQKKARVKKISFTE